MRKHKRVIIISLVAVIVLAATMGIVAFAQADVQGIGRPQSANISMFEKISTIYKANTGTSIDAAELQKAFTQAQQNLATEARDTRLQKLVAAGKITQKQADDYTNWLNSMPSNPLSDQYKQWLQSRPQGMPFGPEQRGLPMPRAFGGMDKMFRNWCPPGTAK